MKPILKSKYSLVGASAALALVLGGCVALDDAADTETIAVTEEVEVVVVEETAEAEQAVQEKVEEVVDEFGVDGRVAVARCCVGVATGDSARHGAGTGAADDHSFCKQRKSKQLY